MRLLISYVKVLIVKVLKLSLQEELKSNLSIIVIEQSPFDKFKVHAVENSMAMFT